MDDELSNSLEAIANLLYLIRKSPHDPTAVSMYVGLAEDRMKAIAIRYGQGTSPESVLPQPCTARYLSKRHANEPVTKRLRTSPSD
jgi:hypothetical protein